MNIPYNSFIKDEYYLFVNIRLEICIVLKFQSIVLSVDEKFSLFEKEAKTVPGEQQRSGKINADDHAHRDHAYAYGNAHLYGNVDSFQTAHNIHHNCLQASFEIAVIHKT